MSIFSKISGFFFNVYVFSLDFLLTFGNLVVPKKAIGHVIPAGHPGAGGEWPEYVPPKDGDSRCSCPALNAMANHGIIPHDGKNIPFTELTAKICTTYNFSESFCLYVPHFSADFLHKKYGKDKFDLHELDLHNIGIEHDASLTREDASLVPDQSKPSLPLVEGLLAAATGKSKDGNDILTPEDLSRYSSKRRVDACKSNPDYQLDFFHKMFGSSNSSTMLIVFGGIISDLKPWLAEERIPDKWEPRIRDRFGLTFLAFNKTVMKVENGIDEKKIEQEDADATAGSSSQSN